MYALGNDGKITQKPVILILPANLSGNSSLAKLEDETEAKTMQIWKKLFMVWQKKSFLGIHSFMMKFCVSYHIVPQA